MRVPSLRLDVDVAGRLVALQGHTFWPVDNMLTASALSACP